MLRVRVSVINRFFVICRALLIALFFLTAIPCFIGDSFGQRETPTWSSIFESIHNKYYNIDLKGEAIVNLADAIKQRGNGYSDDILVRILAMEKEYFGDVSNDMTQFHDLIYSMFKGVTRSRIDRIVKSFEGKPGLYRIAAAARLSYFTPTRAVLKLGKKKLSVGEATAFSVRAFNDDNFDLGPSKEVDVTIKDPSIARVEQDSIRGLRPGNTVIELADASAMPLGKEEVEVLPSLTLAIEPSIWRLKEREKKDFDITASKVLDDIRLEFKLDPPGYAELKEYPPPPNSKKQIVNLTALKPLLGEMKLDVYGPEGSRTFATVVIKPDPTLYKPDKKWPIAASGLTAGLLYGAFSKQSAASDKRNEEKDAARQADEAAAKKAHDEYVSLQHQAYIFWGASTAVALGAGYLWYEYFAKQKVYQSKLEEEKKYSSLYFQLSPAGEIAAVVRF